MAQNSNTGVTYDDNLTFWFPFKSGWKDYDPDKEKFIYDVTGNYMLRLSDNADYHSINSQWIG